MIQGHCGRRLALSGGAAAFARAWPAARDAQGRLGLLAARSLASHPAVAGPPPVSLAACPLLAFWPPGLLIHHIRMRFVLWCFDTVWSCFIAEVLSQRLVVQDAPRR